MAYIVISQDELNHYGVKGMKWGIRRYQNEDGSYTKRGIKRYALDRDVNDTSRRNVAKIRTGEAKRRLDVAKTNKNKPDNRYRVAELRGRVRSAKRMERQVRSIDRGAKLAARGQTITGNKYKVGLVNTAAYLGQDAFHKTLKNQLNRRLSELYATGQYRQGHANAAKLISTLGDAAYYGTVTAYNIKKSYDNKALRAYSNSKWNGEASIKRVGSEEYKYRKEQTKKRR